MTGLERMLCEAVGNMLREKSSLGIVDAGEEIAHSMQFQWEGIEEMFALKTMDSKFHNEVTAAFHQIHSYKFIDHPRFALALEDHLKSRGVPAEEIQKAVKVIEEIKKELGGENFQETAKGWHKDLKEIADITTNADDRKPKNEEANSGGGPAPKKSE